MSEYGTVLRIMAAVLFSKSTSATDYAVQFAACTVTKMTSGIYFIDHAVLLHWEHFFPGLASRWYDMLCHKQRVTGEKIRQYTRIQDPPSLIVHGVGYPKTLAPYYQKIHANWTPLDVAMDDMQLLSMEFYAAREYSNTLSRAKLQFAHFSQHHDLVYANPILKGAVSLALMMHQQTRSTPCYSIKSTPLSVSGATERPTRHAEAVSRYVLTR